MIDAEKELFSSNMRFTGKHADYLRKLAPSKKVGEHVIQRHTVFSSNIEVLTAAPIIGFVFKRKGTVDKNNSITDNTIFQEQMMKIKRTMLRNYRIILLLDNKDVVSAQDRMDRAFKYDRDVEKRKEGYDIFISYLLGGIEVLYEKLLEGSTSLDEDYMNCCIFVKEYKKIASNEVLKENILKLCDEASL